LIPKIWLSDEDRARLQRYVEWLLRIDDRCAVRVLTRGAAAGFYGATPSGVMTFIAVPLVRIEAEIEPVDEVMSARLLLGSLQVDDGVGLGSDLIASPVLAALPPADTWLPGERGIVGDVAGLVDRSVAEGVDADTSVWGGFTLDALRVAKGLGLFSHPGAQVVAATNAGWKRLMTPAGQIFVPPTRTGRGFLRVVH
jgi:hypothetical protein